jgi:signal transduction histidine kinase
MNNNAGIILLFSFPLYILTLCLTRLMMGSWDPYFSLTLTVLFGAVLWARDRWMQNRLPSVMRKNLFREFCKLLSRDTFTEEIYGEILTLLKKNLRVREVFLYLEGSKEDYTCYVHPMEDDGRNRPERILFSDPFIHFIRYGQQPFYKDLLTATNEERKSIVILERMEQLSAEVLIPLNAGENLMGFITLGPKENGQPHTAGEIEILEPVFTQISLVVKNQTLSENLSRFQARMRRTDRLALLGTLTAGLAHEIRNPLVSIKTYFQLLPEKYDDHEFRDRFQKVAANEVDRISRLVEELLTFARPVEPRFRSVNIHNVINEVLTLLESTAQQKGVQLSRAYEELDTSEILCDPEQIKQVLINIAQNAIESMNSKGTVFFRTRYDNEDETSGFVHIEIEDAGIGINAEDLEKLFVPFYTSKTSGTGLGLAISRQIIEEHLGSISVESDPGRGTTFSLHLPISPPMHERRKEKRDSDLISKTEMVH